MFNTQKKLILASASPRRQKFLTELGLEFAVCPADVDETVRSGERALDFVERVSAAKAFEVARNNSDAWILSADTAVVVDGRILGKPSGQKEAEQMILSLVGRTHQVWTGFSVQCVGEKINIVRSVKTDVTFGSFSEKVVQAYAATGDSLDKAGAYGIQGIGGFLVREISGSYSNVVGLPMTEVIAELLDNDVVVIKP